jgi:predicted pyridoxine 5'-phosphate oxidase superfamily flavin-nucleotide-binding protein
MMAPTFHAGERAVQQRVGVAGRMADLGPRVIRDFMPDQHRDFFEQLPFVIVGAVDADGTLTLPDFLGNFFFNTLSNIAVNPGAGLLFIDFDSGDLLYLAVKAEIVWDGPELRAFEAALPLRWGPSLQSPVLDDMGR